MIPPYEVQYRKEYGYVKYNIAIRLSLVHRPAITYLVGVEGGKSALPFCIFSQLIEKQEEFF
jgi:hypothetical protein